MRLRICREFDVWWRREVGREEEWGRDRGVDRLLLDV